jgi:hypothetical protein
MTARDATIAARATTSPFPTAVDVSTGSSTSAEAKRDGLSFRVDLPKETYAGGEGGLARVTLRNESGETLFVQGYSSGSRQISQIVLLDEQGREPAPYPWRELSFPDIRTAPSQKLVAGEVFAEEATFQVPPLDQVGAHHFVLWAETRVSRAAPDQNDTSDGLALRFEIGPIPLHLVAPNPSQRLVARLEVNRQGSHLQVADARGQVPNHPLWGEWEATSGNSMTKGPLDDNARGEWSSEPFDWMGQNAQIAVRAWVTAPGYVTAVVTGTVPGAGDAWAVLNRQAPTPRQAFSSLDAAQSALGLPVYRPSRLTPVARLSPVQAEVFAWDSGRRSTIYEMYQLGSNGWLELTQMNSTEQSPSEGWGVARWDPEARVVAVNRDAGALIQHFGWWVLDWKVGNVGLELHAPVNVFSAQELIDLASSVEP